MPLYFLPELREMYFGDWEGLTFQEIQKDYSQELEKRKEDVAGFEAPGGGESVLDFSKRVIKCFEKILSEQKGNDIIIVAHGGVNRVILSKALGLGFDRIFNIHQDYGCLNIIDYFSDSTLIRLVNG